MFKRFCFLIFAFLMNMTQADVYRGVEYRKLPNGVSVVFLDTNKTEELYVTICISAGKSDDLDKTGKAELLGKIFLTQLKLELSKEAQLSGAETTFFIGHDESLFFLYGKRVDVSDIIKCMGRILANLKISQEELDREKEEITVKTNLANQLDKNRLRAEVLRSLYWHADYGKFISIDELKSITIKDLYEFKSENYANERITLLIAGNVNKEDVLRLISKYFQSTGESKIKRLIEPPHHGATTRIRKNSNQVQVSFIELYWKIPTYKGDPQTALALDIFLTYLKDELRKSLVNQMGVATAIEFIYSFWSYMDGHLCISVTTNKSAYSRELEYVILNEIRRIALEVSDTKKLEKAKMELFELSNVFTYQNDIIDSMIWLSEKFGAGYDYESIRKYPRSVKEAELEGISETAIKLFKNDPDVVSVLDPKEKSDAI